MDLIRKEYGKRIKRFNKVVIWGVRTGPSHKYMHGHFYTAFQKMGTPVLWVDDEIGYSHLIEKGDLVISVNIASDHLPIVPGVYYCLLNCSGGKFDQIAPSKRLSFQVYVNASEKKTAKWDEVTFFDKNSSTLYQPWATDLLPWEFHAPVFNDASQNVYWVGSIWNDEWNNGNLVEMEQLKRALGKHHLNFIHHNEISDQQNVEAVRVSRIAPAIGGRWQVDHNYLPCRTFKNISYGQLGISNIKKFESVFNGCVVTGNTIEEIVDKALSLPRNIYLSMIIEQQEITKNHTYLTRIVNIMKAFEEISSK